MNKVPNDFDTLFLFCAESEGFKPPIPERGIPDFESSAIDHSANSPNIRRTNLSIADAKVVYFSDSTKGIDGKLQNLFEREFLQAVFQLLSLGFADA